MVGLVEFTGGLKSAQVIFDIIKGMKSHHDAQIIRNAVQELQRELYDENVNAATEQKRAKELQGEIERLEEEIKQHNDRKSESSKYYFTTYGKAKVFRRKKDKPDNEPDHYICPQCYHDKRISYLIETNLYNIHLKCNVCKLDVSTGIEVEEL